MEEKETNFRNFFRSVFSHRSFSSHVFRKQSLRGFTLVELLIVIALIGILSTAFIVLVNPIEQMKRSRDSDRKADLKVIQSALELYRSDQGFYLDDSTSSNTAANCSGTLVDICGATTTITYLESVPRDPKLTTPNGGDYYYCSNSSCGASTGGYAIYACVESLGSKDYITPAPSFFACSTNRVFKVINP